MAHVSCRSALLLGILYLTFQAFPIIFGRIHHFAPEFVGLSFLGIGVGMIIGMLCQPFFNRYVLLHLSVDVSSINRYVTDTYAKLLNNMAVIRHPRHV